MIWHSVFLMTFIDLLIIGVASVSLWVLYKNRISVRKPQTKFGPLMIVIGLVLIGSFYLGDLFIMHVLPVFITAEETIYIMEDVHLNYSWPVILFGTASVVAGFTLINRDLFSLIKNLESSEKKLTGELTARQQTEAALRESEERFRAVVDNSPTKIHIKDLDGRYTLINRQSKILFGVTNEEARGKTSRDIFPKEVADSFAGHDQAVIESGQTIENEEEWVCDDGVHTFLTVKFPIRGTAGEIVAVGAIGTDITGRKRTEEALRESEERFRDVAEATSDWFWEMDENLRFTFFSGGRQERNGLSPKKNIGKTRWEVAGVNPDDDEKWRDHRATLEAHEPFRDFEYAFTRKNGKTKYNKVSGTPVSDANGVFKGYRGAATDVTEQKEAQAQLIQASKLATLGEMASGIAHELNQPLSVVGMAAENTLMSMEEGAFDTEFVRKKLQTIVGQKERMAGIVNHMRLFSRRETTSMEPFDPIECVVGAIGLIGTQFQASGIELKEDLPATCGNVSGYPLQLEQVVLNLLNNARDAVVGPMESAFAWKSRHAPKVRISLVEDKRRKTVVISVADNGGGIPKQTLERIFDPFFTTKKGGHGTGLGLSIGYSIINSMGGRLEAGNVDGGAEFRVTLPAAVVGSGATDRPPKGKKRKSRTKKPGSDLPRVLFVDDEEAIIEEVAEYLRGQGYDVVTAGSGLEALELHRSRPADIVITDLLMPEMDGNELISRLHRTQPDLPIMVMTGHTTFGDEKETIAEGASVVLKKPINLRDLSTTLNHLAHS